MITSKQVFKNKDRADLEVSHAPKLITAEYIITLEQANHTITLDIYDLKRISRVANKNIKELKDDPGLRERIEREEKNPV